MSRCSKIARTEYAFAALKDDGTVVSWGFEDYGGGQGTAQTQLSSARILDVVGNDLAFSALREDGFIISWGEPIAGGSGIRN